MTIRQTYKNIYQTVEHQATVLVDAMCWCARDVLCYWNHPHTMTCILGSVAKNNDYCTNIYYISKTVIVLFRIPISWAMLMNKSGSWIKTCHQWLTLYMNYIILQLHLETEIMVEKTRFSSCYVRIGFKLNSFFSMDKNRFILLKLARNNFIWSQKVA